MSTPMRRTPPRCCARAVSGHARAAEERDEIAASHSITSSARASIIGGMVRPAPWRW